MAVCVCVCERVCMHANTRRENQASIDSLAIAGHILCWRERGDRCLSKHGPMVASCVMSMSIWPGSGSQLPEQLQAFWPDLNSEDGPRGPGIAPELRVESGRLPIPTTPRHGLTPEYSVKYVGCSY